MNLLCVTGTYSNTLYPDFSGLFQTGSGKHLSSVWCYYFLCICIRYWTLEGKALRPGVGHKWVFLGCWTWSLNVHICPGSVCWSVIFCYPHYNCICNISSSLSHWVESGLSFHPCVLLLNWDAVLHRKEEDSTLVCTLVEIDLPNPKKIVKNKQYISLQTAKRSEYIPSGFPWELSLEFKDWKISIYINIYSPFISHF